MEQEQQDFSELRDHKAKPEQDLWAGWMNRVLSAGVENQDQDYQNIPMSDEPQEFSF
jgi:hypothetical protein